MSVDIAVGQMRQMEFIADEECDWSLHCHKAHHTMGALEMPLPDNTLPMMSGQAPSAPPRWAAPAKP